MSEEMRPDKREAGWVIPDEGPPIMPREPRGRQPEELETPQPSREQQSEEGPCGQLCSTRDCRMRCSRGASHAGIHLCGACDPALDWAEQVCPAVPQVEPDKTEASIAEDMEAAIVHTLSVESKALEENVVHEGALLLQERTGQRLIDFSAKNVVVIPNPSTILLPEHLGKKENCLLSLSAVQELNNLATFEWSERHSPARTLYKQ